MLHEKSLGELELNRKVIQIDYDKDMDTLKMYNPSSMGEEVFRQLIAPAIQGIAHAVTMMNEYDLEIGFRKGILLACKDIEEKIKAS